jgi:hypothetical protein
MESGAERDRPRRRKFEIGQIYPNPEVPPGRARKGTRWVVVSRDEYSRIATHWTLVKKGRSGPFPTPNQLEESRQRRFGSIEDSLPRGDRDEEGASETPAPQGLPTPEQIEESRRKWFPNIEDTLPEGDKD